MILNRLFFVVFAGLSGNAADLKQRIEVFGSNVIPPKPPKTFLQVSTSLLSILAKCKKKLLL